MIIVVQYCNTADIDTRPSRSMADPLYTPVPSNMETRLQSAVSLAYIAPQCVTTNTQV